MGRRFFVINSSMLPAFFGAGRHRYDVVRDALPADVRIVSSEVEHLGEVHQRLHLVLESAAWEPSEEGKPYPSLDVLFHSID